ncbi:MAG: hypothetical protein KAT39_00425 [Alphaproteobacteria bacterium]|nr:hypothetical protein [Alphaproteobacteria bacterium]
MSASVPSSGIECAGELAPNCFSVSPGAETACKANIVSPAGCLASATPEETVVPEEHAAAMKMTANMIAIVNKGLFLLTSSPLALIPDIFFSAPRYNDCHLYTRPPTPKLTKTTRPKSVYSIALPYFGHKLALLPYLLGGHQTLYTKKAFYSMDYIVLTMLFT